MLTRAVETYLAVRRAAGFALKRGSRLKSFAAFSEAGKQHYVSADIAIEWAGLAQSIPQRARRLGIVIRFARYLRAEDERHEVPRAIFGAERSTRPTPYILTASRSGNWSRQPHSQGIELCRATYRTLFALLACTGLRVSEAIHLRFDDITPDGLVIRRTKFRKSRLVPLHETAQAGLQRYLQQRRPYAPFDDHVFVCVTENTSRCPIGRGIPQRGEASWAAAWAWGRSAHASFLASHFRRQSLQTCPDGRDAITKHMLALSTYLGHSARWPTRIGIWKRCRI